MCVSIMWQLYGVCGQLAVQICTEDVRKCSLEPSGPHEVVQYQTRSRIRTPTVRGTMGPNSLCSQHLGMCKQPALAV